MTSSTKNRADLPLSQATDGELTQFKSCLTRAGFDVGAVIAVGTAPGNQLARAMFAAVIKQLLGKEAEVKAVEFTSPEAQIAKARAWNRQFALGFSEADFAWLERTIPVCPTGRLVAVTLVVSLGTVEGTAKFLWERAAEAQPDPQVWGFISFSRKKMRLIDGQACPKGMRWKVVDLGANTGRSTDQVMTGSSRPQAYAVLASAAMHPLWVQAMDGDNVPYAFEPSIECTIRGYDPWRCALCVSFCRDDGERLVSLCALWRDDAYPLWSVPVPPAA